MKTASASASAVAVAAASAEWSRRWAQLKLCLSKSLTTEKNESTWSQEVAFRDEEFWELISNSYYLYLIEHY